MKTYIGIDLGGTQVRVALISEDGKIISDARSESYSQEGPEVVLDNIIKLIKTLDNYEDAIAVGMGIPGPVDTVKGVITLATNLKDFKDFPVVDYLEKALNKRVFLDNDANVAGLAEAIVGAGKGLPIVYYLTHSTGIGGALVVDSKVVSGKSGYAGEVANIVVVDSDEKINHLALGAVENEASGVALARRAKILVDENIEDAKEFFELVKSGNKKALELRDDMAYKFARMMASIAHVADPHCFVIGGGVSNASDLYLDKVKEYYDDLVHPGMRDVKIFKAELSEPGIIGAAMLPKSYGL